MADAVLTPSGGLIPAGTSVAAYFPWQKMLGRAPSGTAVTTAVVTDQGTLTFVGLLPGTLYTAYALVAGRHQYLDFQTDEPEDPSEETDLSDVYSQLAQLQAAVNVLETTGTAYPDASTSTKGSAKLSVSPADPVNPIAVGDNDSRIAQIATNTAAIVGHEDRIDDLETQFPSDEIELGQLSAGGAGTFPVSGNHVTVIKETAPEGTWRVTEIRAWITDGPGSGGSQNLRPTVFDDVGGAPVTGALLGAGDPVTVASPASPTQSFFPIADPPEIEGSFWFGLHADLAPGPNQALAYTYATGGRFVQNSDTYADGTGTPFGALTFDDTKTISFSCVLESVESTGITDVVGAGAADVVVVDGVATVTVPTSDPNAAVAYSDYETRAPLAGDAVFYGEPEEAGQVSALSVADVAGTLSFELSADGVSGWVQVTEDASAGVGSNEVASRAIPVGGGYVRRVYTNDAGDQAAFDLHAGRTA